MTGDFRNPLTWTRYTVPVSFGTVARGRAVERLARRLDRALEDVVRQLPPPMAQDAAAELAEYRGGHAHFIDLFYTPIWSFLHWVPAGLTPERRAKNAPIIEQACQAHSLSFFLHMWDDHINDGQLAGNLLRVQLRSLAWRRYCDVLDALSARVPSGSGIVADMIAEYLNSVHRPARARDLDEFCFDFMRQIGIWRTVPVLLATLLHGKEAAQALLAIVDSFAFAWRMMDDVQDVAVDAAGGQQNAVWFVLDAKGRKSWAACRAASTGRRDPEPKSWAAVRRAIDRCGGIDTTLGSIEKLLSSSAELAAASGWDGIARELNESAAFIDMRSAGLPMRHGTA